MGCRGQGSAQANHPPQGFRQAQIIPQNPAKTKLQEATTANKEGGHWGTGAGLQLKHPAAHHTAATALYALQDTAALCMWCCVPHKAAVALIAAWRAHPYSCSAHVCPV
jgi:hypothetical protein